MGVSAFNPTKRVPIRVQTASLYPEDRRKYPPVDGALNFDSTDSTDSYLICPGDRWRLSFQDNALQLDRKLYPSFILKVSSTQPLTGFEFIHQLRVVQKKDDVTEPCFYDHVIIATRNPFDMAFDLGPEAPEDFNAPRKITMARIRGDLRIESGPCVFHDSTIWKVDGLRDDKNGAFMAAIHPTNSESFEILPLGNYHYQTLSVAIPSKAAAILDPGSSRLKGLRIGIKDIFAVKGLKNSLCSRPYYAVATQAVETAPCIKKLLGEGCFLVGVLKLSSFIGREEPTEAIDYQVPFNPRGDGYQSPAGSSSGSAASIASYGWLDATIGSDTTGSGRRPALANGTFALRLSNGQLPLDGMVTIFALFDTQCIFTRSIWTMYRVLTVWLDDDGLKTRHSRVRRLYQTDLIRPFELSDKSQLPSKLLFPRQFFPLDNKVQMFHIRNFLKDLSDFLQVTVTEIDIASEWLRTGPINSSRETLETYLDDVDTKTFLYEFYHSFSTFRSDYRRKFNREPYINEYTRWRWSIAESVTKEENQEALNRLSTYRTWLLDNIFQPSKSDTYMILPIAAFEVNYRDRKTEPPSKQHAYEPLYISPTVQAPELVIPIAEISYASRVSGNEEKLPIAVSIVGNPGTDIALVQQMMAFLHHTRRPSQVSTGSSAKLDYSSF